MKHTAKKRIADYALLAITALLILYFAIAQRQSFLKTLPTLVSLIVRLMLVRANRFAFLIGGTNALLYGLTQYSEGLYFSMISSVIISMPLQYFTFFNWNKSRRSTGNTQLQIMTVPGRVAAAGATVALWLGCFFLLSDFFRGSLALLDSLAFALGLSVSVLAAFRYVESQYLALLSETIALIIWLNICLDDPSNLNYLIISCYNVFMAVKIAVGWTNQYLGKDECYECNAAASAAPC